MVRCPARSGQAAGKSGGGAEQWAAAFGHGAARRACQAVPAPTAPQRAMSAALVPAMIPEQLSVPTAETEEPASEGDAFDLRVIVAGDAALKEHLLQADKAFATWLMERDAEFLRSLVESAEGEYGIDYQHLLTRSQQAGRYVFCS